YFNISTPEPTGVVAVIAPQDSALLGMVSALAPALVPGNTVVLVAAERTPLSAISLAEVLATSDVPGGDVNLLTGSPAEHDGHLASHADVNALDLAGAGELDWPELQAVAAETLKRTIPPADNVGGHGLQRMTNLTEIKTVWHPKGIA